MTIRHLTFSLAYCAAFLLVACGEKAGTTATKAASPSTTAPAGNRPDASGTKVAEGPAKASGTRSPLPPTAGTKLAAYVGKYPFDKVDGVAWNDHVLVKAGVAATVRDTAVRKAITTLEGPAVPIEMTDGKLVSWACEAHNCGPHQWAVLIDPRTGATDVCYFDEEADAAKSRWFLADGKEEKRSGNCQ